jgi:hypothetical protein
MLASLLRLLLVENYFPYEPDNFNPDSVKFWDPKKKLKIMFSSK